MELIFKFDGSIVNNPISWANTDKSLEFDPVNQITTINHDVVHDWEGDVYNLLYDKWIDNDFCDHIDVVIEGDIAGVYKELYRGVINVTTCVFNERTRVVSVKIKDDSYGARVENNKSVRVALDSTETKNGEAISATSVLKFPFWSSTGNYIASLVDGYTVHEAFTFLVGWMTDNKVSFESDFFSSGDGVVDFVCSGLNLRSVDNTIEAPKFSFQQLYDLMRKVRNISMGFESDIDGNPVLRIEDIDYFRTNTDTILLSDVNETKLSFEQSILYTSVKVGSDIVLPSDCSVEICNASNNISYYGFETEYYSLSGECVTAVELDLSVPDPFIVDTNKIQEAVEFDDDSFDNKVFLIALDATNLARFDKSDPVGLNENWYNEAYTNKEILARYQDYLTGTLSLFNLYSGLNLFSATGSQPSSILYPSQTPTYTTYQLPLNVEVYDPYNCLSLVTGRYTPVNDGAYQFKVGTAVDENAASPAGHTVLFFLNIEHYDSGGVLLQKYSSDIFTYITGEDCEFLEWTSEWISMDAGDYTIFTIDYAQFDNPAVTQTSIIIGQIPSGGCDKQYFQCINSRVAVQDAQVNTGEKRQLALTSFEYPVDFETMESFFNDTTQRIQITGVSDREGYINSLKYNYVTGFADIQILST